MSDSRIIDVNAVHKSGQSSATPEGLPGDGLGPSNHMIALA